MADRRSRVNRSYEILRAQTRALERILASFTDGVVVIDRDCKIILFNEPAKRIVGVGASDGPAEVWPETYGLYLCDKITPCPHDQLPLIRALGGETVADAEMFVRNPAMSRGAWISVNATPWRDDAGRIQGSIAVFRDITARREREESLRRLSNAVEHTADGVMVTDKTGEILYVNPAFESISGYSKEELLGRTPRVLKSGRHDAIFYKKMWQTLMTGRVYRGTLLNRTKSGMLYVAEQTVTPMKDVSGDITHFVSVARDVTARRKRREQERELRLAAQVQKSLYPLRPPRIAGIDIAGAAHPAARLCGDYFDYFKMPGDELGVVVADVSGHGLGPALTMVATRAAVRSAASNERCVHRILDRTNTTLVQDLDEGRFVTMILIALGGEGPSLRYANAGHPAGYVLNSSGEVRRKLESTGVPLGIFEGVERSRGHDTPLESGDIIVLVTDGIMETENGDQEFFGFRRVLASVRKHRGKPARRMLELLFRDVHDFRHGGPQADDLTAVICKVNSAA